MYELGWADPNFRATFYEKSFLLDLVFWTGFRPKFAILHPPTPQMAQSDFFPGRWTREGGVPPGFKIYGPLFFPQL